jgi:hypothetical protein
MDLVVVRIGPDGEPVVEVGAPEGGEEVEP